jgi:hypothetical protein
LELILDVLVREWGVGGLLGFSFKKYGFEIKLSFAYNTSFSEYMQVFLQKVSVTYTVGELGKLVEEKYLPAGIQAYRVFFLPTSSQSAFLAKIYNHEQCGRAFSSVRSLLSGIIGPGDGWIRVESAVIFPSFAQPNEQVTQLVDGSVWVAAFPPRSFHLFWLVTNLLLVLVVPLLQYLITLL